MAAQSLRAFFEANDPNVLVYNGTAYGLNPGDVKVAAGTGGNVTITIPQIGATVTARANQQVDPDADYTITIVDLNGNTYVFEGRPKGGGTLKVEGT